MNKIEQNSLIENIMSEFEKTNSQMTELIRLQNELSHAENELIALQIRYVHKNKENEDLKLQLDKKNKLLNEKSTETERKLERFQSLEFHYNDLILKHKLCLECMAKQKEDYEILQNKYQNLNAENKKLDKDKLQLKELFGDQVIDLESSLKKLIEENDHNSEKIKDLRKKCESLQNELDKTKEFNSELIESKENLRKNLDSLKDQYNRNIGEQSSKLDSNQEKINSLQLEIAKLNSKLDESYLNFNEMKTNYTNQIKTTDSLQKESQKKDLKYEELKKSYEKCLYEIQNLNQLNLKQKQDFENELVHNRNKIDSILNDSYLLKKLKANYEAIIKKQIYSYNEHQKNLESLILLFKNQTLSIKNLKCQFIKFIKCFSTLKKKYKELEDVTKESDLQIKNLQEKCFDLESKYSEKCEHLNTLERENYLTRNSLESAMNDINNLSNVIGKKNEECIIKNQTIDRFESVINQLNNELSKRKDEINKRISQIEFLDKHLKEEKNVLDLKMAHMEANLKSKTKQLNQRIDQIKEMNDIVNNLKEEKEQIEYKLEQLENLSKCQKFEIESKNSLIKQLELRVQDTKNEINSLRENLNIELNKNKINQSIESFLNESKIYEIKETQTDEIDHENDQSIYQNKDTNESEYKKLVNELNLNLRIKGDFIESINDTLVLKEAEIARLKTRITLMERKDILNENNYEN